MTRLDYHAAGVDYDALDAFKRYCQQAGAATRAALGPLGLSEPAAVRGESSYLIEAADSYLAHVEEALGTKILVADAMYRLTGKSFYRNVAIDDVSTIVNDLSTSGAQPISVSMYLATGDAAYLADSVRAKDLAEGFAEGCRQAGAAWGGGETQVLKGIVSPETLVLGGSAVGVIAPKGRRILGDVQSGDAIICLASSGVQTNGLTLCRAIADRLPQGYLTPLADGRTYGESLLDASVIYSRFITECANRGVRLHYAAHITGHGWRKLMRLDAPLVYRVRKLPVAQPVFAAIAKAAGLDDREMYGTFNMGAGLAAYVAPADVDATLAVAKAHGYDAWLAGEVREEAGRKAVVLEQLKVEFEGESLNIR
ncbi:MAG: AIR synthase-related protein [Phycisphaerae bacterium]|nr:AIR synthase-related protein [Phycisphaerae bacterium]